MIAGAYSLSLKREMRRWKALAPRRSTINCSVPCTRRHTSGTASSRSNGRQGFGSFHSEDVEVLIRQSSDTYRRPAVYDDLCHHMEERILASAVNNFQFGAPAKTGLFALDDDWTFINHGAFGAALQPLLEEANVWRYMCESQPLRFFDRQLLPMVAHTVREVATFLGCPATELVPLPNVTSGLNGVLNSLPLGPGDELMCLSVTYGSTKKILNDVCAKTGATLNIVPLPLPIESEAGVIATVQAALTASNGRIRAVVIDQITSNTAFCMPVLALATMCQQAGAVVIVDAAHAMFSQDCALYGPHYRQVTDASNLQSASASAPASAPVSAPASAPVPAPKAMSDVVDVWLTNGHKWLSAPKGCAFMWVSPRMAGRLRPAIVSHGYIAGEGSTSSRYAAEGKLLSSYAWDGCRDYAALLTVPTAISLWSRLAARVHSRSNGSGSSSGSSSSSNAGRSSSGSCSSGSSSSDNNSSSNSRIHGDLTPLRQYNQKLLADATAMLADEWRLVDGDFAAPLSMRRDSPMSLVRPFLAPSLPSFTICCAQSELLSTTHTHAHSHTPAPLTHPHSPPLTPTHLHSLPPTPGAPPHHHRHPSPRHRPPRICLARTAPPRPRHRGSCQVPRGTPLRAYLCPRIQHTRRLPTPRTRRQALVINLLTRK